MEKEKFYIMRSFDFICSFLTHYAQDDRCFVFYLYRVSLYSDDKNYKKFLYKFTKSGLMFFIKDNFFFRVHPFNCFSLAIAS